MVEGRDYAMYTRSTYRPLTCSELLVCPWTTRQLHTPPINLPINPGLGSVSESSSPITAVNSFPFTGVS